MTMTPLLINRSANVVFLVSGAGKAQAVTQVIEGPRDIRRYPAQVISPTDGRLIWMLDQAAASALTV
jgi:6-phosphogluconolactonase